MPLALLRATLLSVGLCTLAITNAQDSTPTIHTLFGNNKSPNNSGWGAPTATYTRLLDHDALLTGLRGGWLIDHRLTIGLALYGLSVDVPAPAYDAYLRDTGHRVRRSSQLRMGYGGLLIEPVIGHRSAVHVALPIIIGAGGCGYQTYAPLLPDQQPPSYTDDAQAFFVVEPGIELEVNVVKLVRLGLGVSYRYTSDITLPSTAKDALRGMNAGVSLKIGSF
jgi:hypothetical protein